MSQNSIQLSLNLKSIDNHELDDPELGLTNDPNVNVPPVPSVCGMPLKCVSLVTLAIQNSALTIIMHYSRVSTPPSRAYSAATAVLLNEVLKGSISLFVAFWRIDSSLSTAFPSSYPLDPGQATDPLWAPKPFLIRGQKLFKDVFSPDCWKLSIPAILYVIQNNLQYVAASNLEAATFQVTYQMKILTTAAFSVVLLRRKLSQSQWLALLFLAIGVGVVQIQAGAAKASPGDTVLALDVHTMNGLKGFMAVTAACFTSGLAGVYFEMVLKNSQANLWVRNVQLSLFSLLPALAPVLLSHASRSATGAGGWFSALFQHFGVWAWATVAIQVVGGLVTAMVIKYSDNILKGFATSLSIVISFLASVSLFNFKMSFTFVLGSVIVLVATWLYNQPAKRPGLSNTKGSSLWSWGRNEKYRGFIFSSPRSPVPAPGYNSLGLVLSTGSFPSFSSLNCTPSPSVSEISEKSGHVLVR